MSMERVQASWSCGCEETATEIVAVMKEKSWLVGVRLPPGLRGSCAAKDRWDSSASPGSGGVSWTGKQRQGRSSRTAVFRDRKRGRLGLKHEDTLS